MKWLKVNYDSKIKLINLDNIFILEVKEDYENLKKITINDFDLYLETYLENEIILNVILNLLNDINGIINYKDFKNLILEYLES